MAKVIRRQAASLRTGGSDLPNIPCLQADVPLSNTMLLGPHSVPAKWHLIPSNGFSRVHECDRHAVRRTALHDRLSQ